MVPVINQEHATSTESEEIVELEEKIRGLEDKQQALASSSEKSTENQSPSKEKNAPTLGVTESSKTIPTPVPPPAPTPVGKPSPSNISTAQLIGLVKQGVVAISSRGGTGSGFLVSTNAVVTNAHVVKDVYKADVRLSDGSVSTGYVSARDEEEDIAIISLPNATRSVLNFGDSSESFLAQGDPVYAFGFPFGLKGDVSFKEGSISRRIEYQGKSYLEISNAIQPGNSGGPLVNSGGEVVGINTMLVGYLGEEGTVQGESIKLAIPSGHAIRTVTPMVARAHLPSAEKKKQIDDYESFMQTLDEVIADHNQSLAEYGYAMEEGTTGNLELASNMMGSGKANALLQNLPALPFSGMLRDTTYALIRVIDDMRDITENEAFYYKARKSSNDASSVSAKAALDKRLEENDKKIDQFNLFNMRSIEEAKRILTYY